MQQLNKGAKEMETSNKFPEIFQKEFWELS